ncbi:calcineurin B-like protein 9 [Spinacia oleracea]|uniref:Calcineurin B-like protein n=1 Tax=Spinacia oleracea TaxID=3562 RepID=A0ABM3R4N4_SPIOL|nr:calcineurin B-like protein 9 [Spinacia oleracea]XP_056690571.1 calcineurin B-like protein 9 [Spinacia oleracea]
MDGATFKAFKEADVDLDGKICRSEWHQFVSKNPQLLKIMTLQYLRGLKLSRPDLSKWTALLLKIAAFLLNWVPQLIGKEH